MPRVTLTARAALGALGSLYTANAADLAMTAADTSDKDQTAHTGKVLVVAYNSGAGAHTVTLTSSVDSNGRSGDITTYSVGAGEYAVFGPFDLDGWTQTDGKLYFEADHAEVFLGVVDVSNH